MKVVQVNEIYEFIFRKLNIPLAQLTATDGNPTSITVQVHSNDPFHQGPPLHMRPLPPPPPGGRPLPPPPSSERPLPPTPSGTAPPRPPPALPDRKPSAGYFDDDPVTPRSPPILPSRPAPPRPPGTSAYPAAAVAAPPPARPAKPSASFKSSSSSHISSATTAGKKPRPVITIVEAKPMSQVGFRDLKIKDTPSPKSDVQTNQLDFKLGIKNQSDSRSGVSSQSEDSDSSDSPPVPEKWEPLHMTAEPSRPNLPQRPPSVRRPPLPPTPDQLEREAVFDSKPLPVPPRPAGADRTSHPGNLLANIIHPKVHKPAAENQELMDKPNPVLDNSFENEAYEEAIPVDTAPPLIPLNSAPPPIPSRSVDTDSSAPPVPARTEPLVPLTEDTNPPVPSRTDKTGYIAKESSPESLIDFDKEITPPPVVETYNKQMEKADNIPKEKPSFLENAFRVFPPGAGPKAGKQPPPLPKKSPSVSNIYSASADPAQNGDTKPHKSCDTTSKDDHVITDIESPMRSPTNIHAPWAAHIASSPNDSFDKQFSLDTPENKMENKPKALPKGAVPIFPVQLRRTVSDSENLKSSAIPSTDSTDHSAVAPKPLPKPKPSLMPKPGTAPKPAVAKKPSRRPVSAFLPAGMLEQLENKPKEAEDVKRSKPAWQLPKKIDTREVEPKTNLTPQDANNNRDTENTEKDSLSNFKVHKSPVSDNSEEMHPSKKPGPMKAIYRPTIIRASANSSDEHNEPKIDTSASVSVSNISKRFSSSCMDLSPKLSEFKSEQYNDIKDRSVDDSSVQTTPKPKRAPTIIRAPSLTSLSKPSENNQKVSPPKAQPVPRPRSHISNATSMPNIAKQSVVDIDIDYSVSKQNAANEERLRSTEPPPIARQRQSAVAPSVTLRNKPPTAPSVVEHRKSLPPPRPRAPPSPKMGARHSTFFTDDVAVPSDTSSSKPKPPRPASGPPPRPASGPSKSLPQRPTGKPPVSANRQSPPNQAGPPHLPTRPQPGHPLYHYTVKEPHGIALFDYHSGADDDLTFKSGDVIILLKKIDTDWMYGRNVDKEGIFPVNFIDVVEPVHDTGPAMTFDMLKSSSRTSHTTTKPTHNITGPRCRARFEFESGESDHLNFSEDDMIQLTERVDEEWLKGGIDGKTGIFPVSFVEIIEDLPPPPEQKQRDENVVVATFDFFGEKGELSFKAGAEIRVLSKVNDDWLYGDIYGAQGTFPAGFVDHIPDNLPLRKSPEQQTTIETEVPIKKDVRSSRGNESAVSGIGHCTAIHSYPGNEAGDLSFNEGDDIIILEKISDDWLKGSVNGKTGIFPAPFVEIKEMNTDSSVTPGAPTSKSASHAATETGEAKALFDFPGESAEDLSFKAGDVITLTAKLNDTWFKGKIGNHEGIFPSNFVEITKPLP